MDPRLARLCPGLTEEQYGAESPPSANYNCIAFAAGETLRWWQPQSSDLGGPPPRYFWPANTPDELEITSFVRAFESLGYLECTDGCLESGYEKIAIYDHHSLPGEYHAARQLPNGWWASKFGSYKDLEHQTAEAIQHWRNYRLQRWLKRPR